MVGRQMLKYSSNVSKIENCYPLCTVCKLCSVLCVVQFLSDKRRSQQLFTHQTLCNRLQQTLLEFIKRSK